MINRFVDETEIAGLRIKVTKEMRLGGTGKEEIW